MSEIHTYIQMYICMLQLKLYVRGTAVLGFCPDCPLHTAVAHVSKVLEPRSSPDRIPMAISGGDSAAPVIIA